jgi:hypothetical protein
MGEAGGGLPRELPSKTLHGGAGETSPPAFAAPYLHSLSRILFVFCFERDSHGLSHPFQKTKLLRFSENFVYELDWGSRNLYIAVLQKQMPLIWWVFYRRGLVRKIYAETDPE